ncbi:MAG: RNA 3'-terminal phosphate cyclase [Alphaproteobacteria bacterium]
MTQREIIVDGSEGEGGGQVLRTSLSLSAITGKPVRIENVRGRRKKPGLFRQHLTAFKAAAEICGARMEGAELKSSEIAFYPGEIKGGDYSFSIGSAGSTILVAQTILPILARASSPSTVTITGGTHNMWAPTFDFFDQTFLPLFRSMGGRASAELVKYGFHPAGGGEIMLTVKPFEATNPLELITRGKKVNESIVAIVSNLKRNIAEREVETLLHALNLAPEKGEIIDADGAGPGNAVSLFLEFENLTEVFTNLGRHGVRSEAVAKDVAAQAKDYLQSGAAVGPHLADQLLLPMALGKGGVFTVTDITQHTRTNIDIIRRFLDVDILLSQQGRKCWTIEVSV